jgi:uncharacterized circularly permuted ATP-grasp superfamily protein
MLQDAIRTYHDLLTDDLAAASEGMLDELQRRRQLSFGDRPLCTVLRPRFLTPRQYRFLQARVAVLMQAFNRCQQAALADAAFRKQFRLTEPEEALLEHDPGFRCPMPTARLDAFFVTEDELKFTEFNAETPAGAAYSDGLADAFLALPVMGEFTRRYRVGPLPCRPGVYHALMTAYRQWSRGSEPPRVAILDWREVPTFNEFVLFERYFKDLGLECVIADPREVEYRDGKLTAGDFHITLIYKRVLIGELLERGGLDHPVVRAVCDGAVCMANPFRCKVLYKKASLAVLSDERNARLFTPEELQVIAAHVPWTRVVEERRTGFGGQVIDLVPFVLDNRERFVLKPNDDYGGKGIVLGWTVDAARWEEAVRTALATPYVVQERVTLPREPFPSLVGGTVQLLDRMYDTAPFVSQGECVDGCLTRISADPLLNVTAGGSTLPTFLVEPR